MGATRFLLHAPPAAGPRLGLLETPRGRVQTPAYLPHAARGAVGSLRVSDLQELQAQALSVSLYALQQRPGAAAIEALGGLHGFVGWSGPLLADPGDREVAALAGEPAPTPGRRARGGQGRLLRCDAVEARYTSFIDGSLQRLSPEAAVLLQWRLGADLGRSPLPPRPRSRAGAGLVASWLFRAAEAAASVGLPLFATLPGSWESAGLESAAGFGVACWQVQLAADSGWPPDTRPRLVVGENGPADFLVAVAAGADLVSGDSIIRAGASGIAFIPGGLLDVRAADPGDDRPLDPACRCTTCQFASRGYLRHLFAADEMAGPTLLAYHNLHFLLALERAARGWIEAGVFAAEMALFLAQYRESASGMRRNDAGVV